MGLRSIIGSHAQLDICPAPTESISQFPGSDLQDVFDRSGVLDLLIHFVHERFVLGLMLGILIQFSIL